jgi:hypothetical protein
MLQVSAIVGAIFAGIAGMVTAIRGGSVMQVIRAETKWFWSTFFITAGIYASVWIIQSIWIWLLAGNAGVITAERAAKCGYETPDELRKAWADIGYPRGDPIHHFVQQLDTNIQRFGAKAIHSMINSVPVSSRIHSVITSYQNSSPATVGLNPASYGNVSHMYQYIQTLSWSEQYQWQIALYRYVIENTTWQGFVPPW